MMDIMNMMDMADMADMILGESCDGHDGYDGMSMLGPCCNVQSVKLRRRECLGSLLN